MYLMVKIKVAYNKALYVFITTVNRKKWINIKKIVATNIMGKKNWPQEIYVVIWIHINLQYMCVYVPIVNVMYMCIYV